MDSGWWTVVEHARNQKNTRFGVEHHENQTLPFSGARKTQGFSAEANLQEQNKPFSKQSSQPHRRHAELSSAGSPANHGGLCGQRT